VREEEKAPFKGVKKRQIRSHVDDRRRALRMVTEPRSVELRKKKKDPPSEKNHKQRPGGESGGEGNLRHTLENTGGEEIGGNGGEPRQQGSFEKRDG